MTDAVRAEQAGAILICARLSAGIDLTLCPMDDRTLAEARALFGKEL